MSLRELAAQHGQALLESETPVVLTLAGSSPTVYNAHGKVVSVGVHLDVNGLAALGDHKAVTISTLELAALGLSSPAALKTGDWTISTTDVSGLPISGRFGLVLIDATLARATIYVNEDDE
jgi:hypothetical protein